jgi:hypothetical protein
MGLGLSISRRIIEDHGGNLRLTETTSKGCTFEITLPVVATRVEASSGQSPPLGVEGVVKRTCRQPPNEEGD